MATLNVSRVWDNSTDNNFKAWAQEINLALAAFGWVKTADTGQIDWNTVARPTAANQFMGYEVWRMADTLQATNPVFLKIEYGSGSSNALHPGIALQIGSGSNGAGTLTGQLSARQALTGNGNTTGLVALRFSGATNRFTACLASDFNSAQNSISFCIERSYSVGAGPTLSDTAEYEVLAWATNSTKGSQVVPASGAVPNAETTLQSLISTSGSTVRGTAPSYCLLYPFWGRSLLPIRGMATYMNAEMTGQGTEPGEMGGVQIPFFRAGGTLASIITVPATPAANSRLAVRYD